MMTRLVVALSSALILGLAACALPEKPEAPGYEWRWTGQGRPGNFAADQSHCRRHVNSLWQKEQRARSDRVNRKPPPDRFTQRFAFRQCMKGRRWALVAE